MVLNAILLIVGIIICFGGIYFKKFVSGLLGLFWGAIIGIVITLVMAGSLFRVDEEGLLLAVIVCGVLFAILSVIYDKLCVAINSFVSSFIFVAIFLMFVANFDEFAPLAVISLIVAIIVSVISVKVADYSYLLITAFSGAFIASVGALGLMEQADLSEILFSIMWSGFQGFGLVPIGTIVLGAIGFFVQLKRFGIIKSKNDSSTIRQTSEIVSEQTIRSGDTSKITDNLGWKCPCGQENHTEFCIKCGQAKGV